MRLWGVVFVSLALTTPPARAQVDTGAILGTVRDQSGGVVGGTKITLTNEGAGVSATTESQGDGAYTFSPVRIGVYTVTAEVRGFQTSRQQHVAVNIQQQVVVDLSLLCRARLPKPSP
jgi:hypothetical protein